MKRAAAGSIAVGLLAAAGATLAACSPDRPDRAQLAFDAGEADLAVQLGDAGTGASPDIFFDSDAFWAADPPPTFCALDGGMFPPPKVPGGTPDCPDDKNREGCPCPAAGMTAACWPGLRANRNLGICSDGMTTCVAASESTPRWGPCTGYTLPQPGVTTGARACKCFSSGQWKIADLSPCFADDGTGPGSGGVASSWLDNQMTVCGSAHVLPAVDWSGDTITADCEGHFRLCYTLKAGDGKNPTPQDCTIAEVCTEADYTQVNHAQAFPPLPAFLADSPAAVACAVQFTASGGYGEMSVDGVTVACDRFQRVFNHVIYCPFACYQNPGGPGCTNCGNGGGGSF